MRAVARIGLPGVLKTRRLGYDGKGQARARATRADIDAAWATLGGEPLIYEELRALQPRGVARRRAQHAAARSPSTRWPRTPTRTASCA